METKHTPGPWYVLGPWPSIHVGPMVDGGCGGFGECPEPPQYEPVCCVHQSADYTTEANEEVQANARLIATAPDLLEACKNFIAWYDASPDEVYDFDWERVRAAIAKATGSEVKP